MPKRISKKPARKSRGGRDSNQIAFETIQQTIKASETEAPRFDKTTISEVMRQLGSRGGKIGGKRRLETMTDEQRSQSALRAARARWAKNHKNR